MSEVSEDEIVPSAVPAPGTRRGDLRLSPLVLRPFVFLTGAAVMAVEFSAQRLLQPFFGNSELVWATLIGLILLALSAGYAIGGRLADRWPDPRGLGLLSLGAGLFVAVLPTMASPFLGAVLKGLLNTPSGVVISSILATALLFTPPVAALGAISPYAVRLVIDESATAGKKTGSLYSWSTFGSIVGTFVPAFVSIPDLGVRATLWIAAGVLIAIGALMLARIGLVALIILPLVLSQTAPTLLKPVGGLIAEVETPYQFAQVYRLGNGDIALSVNDSAGIQSIYTKSTLTGLYYDAYLVLPFMFPSHQPMSALLIGVAAGTIPTMYLRDVDPYRARVSMTGVEIDPTLIQLGHRYFHLTSAAAKVKISDGRVYLATSKRRYDLVIVDAYSQEIYIPFSLTTKEFFAQCRAHLTAGGILAMNVNVTSDRSALLLAVERTLLLSFRYVYVAKAPGEYNELVVASNRPVSLPPLPSLPSFLGPVRNLLAATWAKPKVEPGLILTDNRAPVEAMTNAMILKKLGGAL